ncbi:MAG: peptidoglycan-binding protein [Clostridia bacterium]|nr:peptidoglycan-binding protein [Clostridia bacterium]
MKRRLMIWVLVLATALLGATAHAMPVELDEGITLPATTQEGDAVELETSGFQLIGTDGEGAYLVFTDGKFLKVAEADLAKTVSAIDKDAVEALPALTDVEPMSRYDRGEAVEAMQETLIALGYMEGIADGSYGGQSERAVAAFQEAAGIEATGEADPLTQLLMRSMAEKPVEVEVEADAGDAYAALSDIIEVDLDAAIDLGLKPDYDDVTGEGMLSAGKPIAYEVPAQADIDRRTFALTFGLAITRDAEGAAQVALVLDITCVGVQRPGMTEVILKSGDERCAYPIADLEETLSGLDAVEHARVPLDDAGVELLANAVDEEELKIRVTGRYAEYDIPVTDAQIEAVARVGEAALEMD